MLLKVTKLVLKLPQNVFHVSYHVIQKRSLRPFVAFLYFLTYGVWGTFFPPQLLPGNSVVLSKRNKLK